MIIPLVRVNFLALNTLTQSNIAAKIAIAESIKKFAANGTGIIKAVVPITNKMLKILLPTIFPIAISAFPFLAAVTEVTNSGREVPSATMVRPIKLSLKPIIFAMAVALSTVMLLPQTMMMAPTMPLSKRKSGLLFSSSSSSLPFLARRNR